MARSRHASYTPTKLEHTTKYNILNSFKHFNTAEFENISSLADITNILKKVLSKEYEVTVYCDLFTDTSITETYVSQAIVTTPLFASNTKKIYINLKHKVTQRSKKIVVDDAYCLRKYHSIFKHIENAMADLSTPKLKIIHAVNNRSTVKGIYREASADTIRMAEVSLRAELKPYELRVYNKIVVNIDKLIKIISRINNSTDPWVILYPKIAVMCNGITFNSDSSFNGVLTHMLFKDDTSKTKDEIMLLLVNTLDVFKHMLTLLENKK